MPSSTYLKWTQPVAVTGELLLAVEERLQRHTQLARDNLVRNEGLDPAEVKSAAVARELEKKTKNWAYGRVARELEKIERPIWAVHFSNGIRRSPLSIDDVLALPNAGEASIVDLEGVSGTYSDRLEVSLSNERAHAAAVTVRGEYNDVHIFKAELTQLFAGATRNWSFVTKPWVGLSAIIALVILFLAALVLVVAQLAKYRGWDEATISTWVSGIFPITLLVSYVVGPPIVRRWGAIFPLVEFQFGGGKNAAEARRTWRKIMWSFPVLIVGAPLAVSWLASTLFK